MEDQFKRRRESAKLWTRLVAVICLAAFLFVMGGCDEESFESRVEDARIALDKGDYTGALRILENEGNSSQVLEMKSDASVGLVGVDTFKILGQLDENDDSKVGSIDRIGKLLGSGAGNRLDCSVALENMGRLQQAIEWVGNADVTDDNKVRLGLYGFSDFLLTLGALFCSKYESSLGTPPSVLLTEIGVRALKNDGAGGSFDSLSVAPMTLGRLERDIELVRGAADVLGGNNDLGLEFARFFESINPDGGELSASELIQFLNSL